MATAALRAHPGVLVVGHDVGQAYARCMSLEWRCRMAWHVEAAGGAAPMPAEASQKLARGIDRRGYPGLWSAMARQELQLDPRVLDEG
jgi:L-fuculose-phosphate aldolase